MRQKVLGLALIVAVLPACAATTTQAQRPDARDWCRRSGWSDREDRARFCEVRELTLSPRDLVAVDGRTNGGISVRGWDRTEILVQAKVQAWARSMDDAEAIARDIDVRADRVVEAEGPRAYRRREGWSVSYRVYVPRDADLDLEAHNGGIGINGVRGRLRFETTNGGVELEGVAGDVRGRTTNGGLHVVLDGSRWTGEGLDLETTNGGVEVEVPDGYSARLITGTVNGHVEIDFPIMVQGRLNRRIETQLGQGGAPIRIMTTNGSVGVWRR